MIRNINRFKYFGSRPVLYFAELGGADGGAGSGATSSGGAAGGGAAGGGPGAGAGATGAGAGGNAGGAGGTGATGNTIDWKTAPEQFRKGYDELKSKYEPWEKLGVQPDQVTKFQGTYQRVFTAASKLAEQLGYAEDELVEALEADPIKTLNYLQNQAALAAEEREGAGADGDEDLESLVQQHVDQALGPIQKRENQRMTQEANNLFERTCHQELVTAFKEEGVEFASIPGEESFMYITAASELMKYDDKALHQLKMEGKTALVQKYVREAKNYLDKFYMARAQRERARAGAAGAGAGGRGQQQQQNNNNNKRPSLEEMIDNPDVIRTSQGKSGYAT
jgi:hypothetical protein